MTQTQAVKAIHRQHHVCGIERMDQVSDDAVHLLAPVDFPCRIVFIDDDGAVGRGGGGLPSVPAPHEPQENPPVKSTPCHTRFRESTGNGTEPNSCDGERVVHAGAIRRPLHTSELLILGGSQIHLMLKDRFPQRFQRVSQQISDWLQIRRKLVFAVLGTAKLALITGVCLKLDLPLYIVISNGIGKRPILYTPDIESGKNKRSKIQQAWGTDQE